MSKRSKQEKKERARLAALQGGAPAAAPPVPGRLTAVAVAENASAIAQAAAIPVSPPAEGAQPPAETPDALAATLQSLIAAFGKANGEFDGRRKQLDGRERALDDGRKSLDTRVLEFEEELKAQSRDRQKLADERLEIEKRREGVAKREADADTGFLVRRDEIFHSFESARDAVFERLARRESDLETAFQNRKDEAEKRFAERDAALDEREKRVREAEGLARVAQHNADADSTEANDLRRQVEAHIGKRVTQLVTEKGEELGRATETAKRLRERANELEAKLEERDHAARTLEHMSPEAVRRQIDSLRAECERLRDELAARPTSAEAQELTSLRTDRALWNEQRVKLLAEHGRLQSRLDYLMVEVDALEGLRDRNKMLQETQRLLKATQDDLRKDIDERLDSRRHRPVYQELTTIATDPTFSEAPSRLYPAASETIDLEDFATDLRCRLAHGDDDDPGVLYFRSEDVRAMLGGLAMSRLHLLQGISGIGKSSLPRRFAKAVGGFCDTVSVQAGWRDRNDLLGYYNAFEHRYYESPFIQAIFKARTRLWSDRIAIVLLDEMNLSHPEQYAADVLDVLERTDRSKRAFELLPFSPEGSAPDGIGAGRFLPLPENVWFVGTANHDETTKDFADKTYDRSFVLELPPRPVEDSLQRRLPRAPVSCDALRRAFDDASAEYAGEAAAAWEWVEDQLREPMLRRFDVGFGGRLETQSKRFISVVRAAGGPIGEALDQIISTRILRKIRGRHDNLEEDLVHLEDLLEKRWPDVAARPRASIESVQRELRLKRA